MRQQLLPLQVHRHTPRELLLVLLYCATPFYIYIASRHRSDSGIHELANYSTRRGRGPRIHMTIIVDMIETTLIAC